MLKLAHVHIYVIAIHVKGIYNVWAIWFFSLRIDQWGNYVNL